MPDVNTKKIGAVAVVGAGIGGMQSALDLAESGFKVYLIDSAPAIGGNMARLDKTFPTNDCAMCVMSPKLVDCGRHLNIEVLSYTDVEGLVGTPGNFKLKIKKKARYVDISKCTGCEECSKVCPVEINSEFNAGIGKRKAIYRLYPQAVPKTFVIEKKEKPPCTANCPAGINVQGYVALISQGKFKEALEVVKKTIPFPAVCGRVCHHPCETECNRKEFDQAIAIRELKRFVSDHAPLSEEEIKIESNGKKVAIIGAGPAGLSAAKDLALLGYKVTVFESLPVAGGMLRVGILDYRLPHTELQKEIDAIIKLGIEIKLNTTLGKNFTIDKLKQEGYEAIFMATGAHKSRALKIEGENLEGVLQGISFLKDVNLENKVKLGEKVVVIGGGNVAVDVSRAAIRLGAKEVHLVSLEGREEMPAFSWETKDAEEEGIKFHCSKGPKKILGKDGKVTGLECIACACVYDEKGKFNPKFTCDTEYSIPADNVIMAIGQMADNGFISADPTTLETKDPGIFAGGDVVSGPASAIEAIASGKEAAISIDRYLRKVDLKEGRTKEKIETAKAPEVKVETKNRVEMPLLRVQERKNNFKEVELGLSQEDAVNEAKRCLNCGICSDCRECEKVCDAKAINHEMKDELVDIDVGSIILTPGYEMFDPRQKGEYGYGLFPNVISSIQFERILSASGPFEGEILRPSDKKHPVRIAFIQCVGSRDQSCGNDYCSSVCCMYSTKEAIIAKEHESEIQPTIFFIDLRATGKEFEKYYERAQNEYNVRYIRSSVSKVIEDPKSKNLIIKYIDQTGKLLQEEFDLVVLAIGLTQKKENPLAQKLGIELNEFNFCKPQAFLPGKTNREGIFVGGAFSEPKDIPETVVDGSLSASLAGQLLSDARGTLTKIKRYPKEIDVNSEAVRLGIFICRCGRNIASVVDVNAVVESAKTLKDVAYAGEFIYSCSQDSLEILKEKVKEHKLNRVLVASCTPRTHDPIFRDTIREAGLNPALFELISIREQVSWVHLNDKPGATEKAKILVAMGAAKARELKPIHKGTFDVVKNALVIGAGLAGLSSGLSIAKQGFKVTIIEKEQTLGGNLNQLFVSAVGNPQQLLQKVIAEAESNPLIKIHKGAELIEMNGHVGNFKTKIKLSDQNKEEIVHGATVVATGGVEYSPQKNEYGYNQDPRVITQHDLGKKLTNKDLLSYKNIVMIQCVGSRDDEHPWCSRVCCTQAITHAIKLKEKDPKTNIYILYRDIRSYGFKELLYKEAREKGVIFVRYEKNQKPDSAQASSGIPKVEVVGEKIRVRFNDPLISQEISIEPDLLVLSTGILPSPANTELAKILKIPLTADKFFLEKHAKIAPLDFAAEGVFMCGLAHSPRSASETIAQAEAVGIRAATILSKDKLEARAEIVEIREKLCVGCGLCVSACPYGAREIDEETHKARIQEVLCQGCGACCVACPNKASRQKGFSIKAINSMIEEVAGVL